MKQESCGINNVCIVSGLDALMESFIKLNA